MSVLKQVEEKNYVVFVEQNGRTVYGFENVEKSTDTQLAVVNPAIIYVNADQATGQFGVQVVPYLFREFAQDGTTTEQMWMFNRNQITLAVGVVVEARLREQHARIFSAIELPPDKGIVTPAQVANEVSEGSEKVVKLFDDK